MLSPIVYRYQREQKALNDLNRELSALKSELFKMKFGVMPKNVDTQLSKTDVVCMYQQYIAILEDIIAMKKVTAKYTKKRIAEIYDYEMTDDEFRMLLSLNLDEKMSRIQTPTKRVKYVNRVGYIIVECSYLLSPSIKNIEDKKQYRFEIFEDKASFERALDRHYEAKLEYLKKR